MVNIRIKDIDQTTFDLSAKKPNKKEEIALRSPKILLKEIKTLDRETEEVLEKISTLCGS